MPTINIRIDEKLKKQSEAVLEELGMNMTTAITIYLKALVRNNGIPFCLEIPNETTIKAFKEIDDISSGKIKAKRYSSAEELMKDLDL